MLSGSPTMPYYIVVITLSELIMPKAETELMGRDAKRDIGAELLESVRQMKAGRKEPSIRLMCRRWCGPTPMLDCHSPSSRR